MNSQRQLEFTAMRKEKRTVDRMRRGLATRQPSSRSLKMRALNTSRSAVFLFLLIFNQFIYLLFIFARSGVFSSSTRVSVDLRSKLPILSLDSMFTSLYLIFPYLPSTLTLRGTHFSTVHQAYNFNHCSFFINKIIFFLH